MPVPVPLTGLPSPLEVLGASFAAMDAAGSFHFEMDVAIKAPVEGADLEIPITLAGDFQAPDRVRGSMAMSLGFFTLEMEMVSIGETTYMTSPQTGEWEVVSDTTLVPPNLGELAEAGAGLLYDAVLVGEETLDGTPVYQIGGLLTQDVIAGLEPGGQVALWIGVDDSLIYRIGFRGEVSLDDLLGPMDQAGLSGQGALFMTARFSGYGVPVTIEPPIL